jgi:DNA invertase Pin-like site-specific DNA recombinase
MQKIIAYYRVSTQQQSRSGLGMDAQRAAVAKYVADTGATVMADYTEQESGGNNERPELTKAIAHASRSGYLLVVAKLDRLARDVEFLAALQKKPDVRFIALDAPFASPEMLQMMMVFAQWERKQISERTKAALAAAKKRGVQLGFQAHKNQNTSRRKFAKAARTGRKLGSAVNQQRAAEKYRDILPAMVEWREAGDTLEKIADRLNSLKHTTRTGREWNSSSVYRVLQRQSA